MIAAGEPLAGEEMIAFMREQSDDTRRLLFDLNGSYHTPEEIVTLFSQITNSKIDNSFRLFPPFYTDFGKNIHVGKNVFINSCCQFQDQGGIFIGDGALIGHSVVMATLNHGFAPNDRQNLYHAPIHIGKGAWIGAHATILPNVTIGDNAIVGAGSVVTKDVPDNAIVAGNPARFIRNIKLLNRMKPFIIALTLYLFVNISSCSTNDAPIVEPPNGETAEDSNTPTMNEQIRIIIGNASFTATLEDNATTKAFKASLPITVNMTEQAGNEKFYYLPTALPTSTVTPGTIFAGDLMLWGNSCLVLFYETFSSPYSYTRIGKIDKPSGLSAAVGDRNITVTFE